MGGGRARGRKRRQAGRRRRHSTLALAPSRQDTEGSAEERGGTKRRLPKEQMGRKQGSTYGLHLVTLPPVSSRIHHAKLVSKRVIADATWEFCLAHDEPELRFRPGQFVSIEVGRDADDQPVLRSYSLASGPEHRDALRLVVRLVPGGKGSAFFAALELGDRVRFTGPMGFFVNELSHGGDVIYAATGTGMAPMLPMIEETLCRRESGRVLLFWGLRREIDCFWQDELAALTTRHARFAAQIFLSQPQGFSRLRGRIVGPIVESLPSLREPTFYLCGNGQMIEELKTQLQARGVSRKRQIRTEAFFE